MVAISVAVNRKAALLLGNDLPARVTIDVTPDLIGKELWPALVGMLNTTPATPELNGDVMVAEATAEAVRDAIVAIQAEKQAQVKANLTTWHELLERVRAACAAGPRAASLEVPGGHGVDFHARYEGWVRVVPYVPSLMEYERRQLSAAEAAEVEAIIAEAKALIATSAAEIAALNANELEAALPALREAHAVARAEAEAEAAAKEKELQERGAARLASGYWERETAAYNPKREGAPWCARITGTKARGELVYEFADSTARHGSAGLLRVACRPGDIIAWGQKDMRRADKSEHRIQRMKEDGLMEDISRTDAFRALS